MNSTNLTDMIAYALDNSPFHQAMMLIFFIPITFLTVFGNTLVILAVCKEPRLRTPSYVILTSLAISDLLTGLVATPVEVFSRIIQSELTCSRAKSGYFSIWQYVFCAVSIMHLFLVTGDRLIAIKKPLRYVTMVTTPRVLATIGIVWTAGISYGICSALNLRDSDDNSIKQLCSGMIYKDSNSKNFFIGTAVIIQVVCLFLIVSNLYILHIAIRQAKKIRPNVVNPRCLKEKRQAKQEGTLQVKATRTVVFVVGFFCLSWLPSSIWFIMRSFVTLRHVGQIIFFEVTFFISIVNSAMNPFIYCFNNSLFRQTFYRIIPPLENFLVRHKIPRDINTDKLAQAERNTSNGQKTSNDSVKIYDI